MSRFHSTRQALNAVDASRSSASSLDPTLSKLSPEDAEILEAIVAKCPEATTFMTVFKAYSEVLQQRGLDPGNDVVYYKQLLKLGVVKGSNWGTKWNIVKGQLSFDSTAPRLEGRILPSQLTGLTSHEEDVFTLHSHADGTETAVDPHVADYAFHRPCPPEASVTNAIESFDLHSEISVCAAPSSNPRAVRQLIALRNRIAPTFLDSSEVSDEVPIRSSTPLPRYRKENSRSPTPKQSDFKDKGRGLPASHINEAEAWKKLEQERHIEDADRFRRESLLSTCFETWKVGLDWIRSTHAQIVNARNHVQLRRFFKLWREKNAMVKQVYAHATRVALFKVQRGSFEFWRERTHRKRIAGWREDMRSRMAKVRRKRDERIRNDAWTKWRQSYRSRQLYAGNVLTRAFRRWRKKLHKVTALELLADSFEEARERRTLGTAMETWSRRIQMRDIEKYVALKASRRTLSLAFQTWARNAQDNRYADAHHALWLLKRAFGAWRNAKANMHVLSHRGEWHLRRRDNLLLRAVVRVWVARERGQLLQRVKSTRLMKDAFFVWWQRRQKQLELQSRALDFTKRGSAALLSSTFSTWMRHCNARKSALLLGEQHYMAFTLSRVLLVWRLQLRATLRMARRAKMARRYFLEKSAWDKWRFAIAENRRESALRRFESRMVKRMFSRWLDITRKKRHQGQAVIAIQRLVCQRILRSSLQHWTSRVVDLKIREMDVAEQYERVTLAWAFTKWKDMCHQHVENLSLVNSFQDVKREDTLRRVFLKWSAAARKSKDRRTRLAEREHELRLETIRAAWDVWRDHFRENMLRSIEYKVIIQNQTNLIYRTFIRWHSHSKSVPGIRFYAINLKTKVWNRWRLAMPLAVQARKARETDARNVLRAAFKRWTEVYRTKLALKAVARARYLRLPSPGQRAPNSILQPLDPPPLRPLLHRPLYSRVSGPKGDGDEPVPGVSHPSTSGESAFSRRRGLSSLLAARPASRAATAVEIPPSRPAAPPSSTGGNDRREKLWKELRGAGLRETTGRGRAKSR